jgi:hypothetical protein
LEEWLLLDDYFALGSKQFKNRNQIIKNASNTEGGSHYSDEKEHIVETLENEQAFGINNLTATLLDIGELVFYLGHILLLKYEYKNIEQLKVITDSAKFAKLFQLDKIIKQHKQRFSVINNHRRFNGIFTATSE